MKWFLGLLVLGGISWAVWWMLCEPSGEALVERLEFVEYEEKPWLVLYGFRLKDSLVPKLDEGFGGAGNRTSFARETLIKSASRRRSFCLFLDFARKLAKR